MEARPCTPVHLNDRKICLLLRPNHAASSPFNCQVNWGFPHLQGKRTMGKWHWSGCQTVLTPQVFREAWFFTVLCGSSSVSGQGDKIRVRFETKTTFGSSWHHYCAVVKRLSRCHVSSLFILSLRGCRVSLLKPVFQMLRIIGNITLKNLQWYKCRFLILKFVDLYELCSESFFFWGGCGSREFHLRESFIYPQFLFSLIVLRKYFLNLLFFHLNDFFSVWRSWCWYSVFRFCTYCTVCQ